MKVIDFTELAHANFDGFGNYKSNNKMSFLDIFYNKEKNKIILIFSILVGKKMVVF